MKRILSSLHLISTFTMKLTYWEECSKHDDFDFPIVKFPFLSDIITSQLNYYSRVCGVYSDFIERARLMTTKLPNQGYDPPSHNPSYKRLISLPRSSGVLQETKTAYSCGAPVLVGRFFFIISFVSFYPCLCCSFSLSGLLSPFPIKSISLSD